MKRDLPLITAVDSNGDVHIAAGADRQVAMFFDLEAQGNVGEPGLQLFIELTGEDGSSHIIYIYVAEHSYVQVKEIDVSPTSSSSEEEGERT